MQSYVAFADPLHHYSTSEPWSPFHCSLHAGDVGIAVCCYVIASSAAVAADLFLDQDRMDWYRRMATYWFAFNVMACAASCVARPLTNRDAMSLIFDVNTVVIRTVGLIILWAQTIKVLNRASANVISRACIFPTLISFFAFNPLRNRIKRISYICIFGTWASAAR